MTSTLGLNNAEARWLTLIMNFTGRTMIDQVSVLPLELWARVFKVLEPTPGTPDWDWYPVMLKAQTSFWQLPLVCKGFCNVFRTHPELGHHILLNKKKLNSGNQRVAASLVPWLEARAAVVKTFHANHWSKDVIKYLTALEHQSSALTDLQLEPRHMTEVSCLASFTALTSCCLQPLCDRHFDTVDLTPLQGLQMLTKLALNRGCYCSLSAVSHLTNLDLNTARISDSDYCTFASNLIHLRVQTSDLDMLHARGLMACVALQSLEISEHCTVDAEHGEDCLDTFLSTSGDIRIAADFSSLACLTNLQLSLRNHSRPSRLFGLGTIPHLQSLHLTVPGKLKSRSPQVAASLVPWLEARAAFVKTFHANDWSMDVVKYLRTLQHQSSGLTVIELKTIHNHEVICLSSFTALTSCCLHPSLHHDTLDSRPLQGLQVLTKLALNRGDYSNLSSMSHLKDLDLNRAHIYDSGYSIFASNLIHLKMQKSDLDGLHAWGLMACIALQSFEISKDCTIGAKHWVDCLNTSVSPSGFVRNSADFSPRADFSSLACLTALRLSLRSHGQPPVWSQYPSMFAKLTSCCGWSCRHRSSI